MTIVLSALQMRREQEALEEGRQRYLDRDGKMKTESAKGVPHKVISGALDAVSLELAETIKSQSKVGTKTAWYETLKDMSTDLLAYIGLNSCFDGILMKEQRTSLLVKIGRRVEIECFSTSLKKHDKGMHKRLVERATVSHSSQPHRYKSIRNVAAKEGFKVDKWSKKFCIQVGAPVLDAILKGADVFQKFETNDHRGKTKIFIQLTKEAEAAMAQHKFDESWLEPCYSPMVVPPRPWSSFSTGCYLDPFLASSVPLVKHASRQQQKLIEDDFKRMGTPPYVEALNAVQRTPLSINRRIYEAVDYCWKADSLFAKFPTKVEPTKQEMPEDFDSLTKEQKKGYVLERRNYFKQLQQIKSDKTGFEQTMAKAEELLGYDKFYLPWNFDWRGRMYPVSHFHYQRDDHCKALFQFANGRKVSPDNVGWLYIHAANAGDFGKISKQPLEDRIQWTEEHLQQILAVADDFRATTDFWQSADKPFQFLAACYAIADYVASPDDFRCYLPISIDGTNSGVQHYSSLMLSSEDAARVNLVPSAWMADVYQDVADEVTKRLQAETEEPALAKLWLDYGIGRKDVKRNVMTFGYSSNIYGFKDQLKEDLMKDLSRQVVYGEIKEHPFGQEDLQEKAAYYLAKINYSAIQDTLASVAGAMEFLQECCTEVAKEGKSVSWRTPIGFPCVQRYRKWTGHKIKISMWDRTLMKRTRSQVTFREENPWEIDSRKMKAGIAPNVIHSLDACHMQSTVLSMLDNDVTDFFMIHDSFGTQCDHMWPLFQIVRNTFVQQYDGPCFLSYFRNELDDQRTAVEPPLPPVPTKGDLSVSSITDSEFCFS